MRTWPPFEGAGGARWGTKKGEGAVLEVFVKTSPYKHPISEGGAERSESRGPGDDGSRVFGKGGSNKVGRE